MVIYWNSPQSVATCHFRFLFPPLGFIYLAAIWHSSFYPVRLIVASVTWQVKGRHLLNDMLLWVLSLIMASPTYKPFLCVIWSILYWLVIVGVVVHASLCRAWMLSPLDQLSGLCSSSPNTSVNTVFNAHSSLNQNRLRCAHTSHFPSTFTVAGLHTAYRLDAATCCSNLHTDRGAAWLLLISFWKASHCIRRHNCNSL